MPTTVLEGVVEDGRIRLRGNVTLAENTRVYVIVADMNAGPPAHARTPHLAHPKQAGDFRKQVVEICFTAEP